MTSTARQWTVAAAAGLTIAAAVAITRLSPPPMVTLEVVVLVASAWMMHRLAYAFKPTRLTLPGFWWWTFLALTAVPVFILTPGKPEPYASRLLWSVSGTLLTVPVGMAFVNALAGFRRREIDAFFEAPVDMTPPDVHRTTVFLVALTLALVLTVAYVIEAPVLPLLEMLRHANPAELTLQREESFKLLDSPLRYAYAVLRSVVYPVLISLSLGYYLVTRRRLWAILFGVTAVAGFLYAALPIAKMPAAIMVLVSLLFVYLFRGGRVDARRLAFGVALVFTFPVLILLGTIVATDIPWWLPFRVIFARLFELPAEILYHYFELFPDRVGYLHGQTIGRMTWLTGQPTFDIANFVYRDMYPLMPESGTAPGGFVANLHADFGPFGVVAGGLLLGMTVQLIQVSLLRRRKSVRTLAAYAVLYFGFLLVNLLSFPEAMWSGGVLLSLGMLWLLRGAEAGLRRATLSPPATTPPLT